MISETRIMELAKEAGIKISKPSLNLGQGMVVEPMYYSQLVQFANALQAEILKELSDENSKK